MARTAIAYVSDIIVGRTGDVISRDEQRSRITQYAKENDIQIQAWFEDRIYNEDILMRPGIQEVIGFEGACDMVLVDRVWSLSRSMTALDPLFAVLDRKGLRLESASYLWDCTSQMCRRRFAGSKPGTYLPPLPVVQRDEVAVQPVQRPAHAFFAGLVKVPSRI